jgi:uncharacterized membrane protein YeaQ/YmgE (transglycosylase-associated protein family)
LARVDPHRVGRRGRRLAFFTALLGIGDTDVFDWGGILGAILGAIVVLFVVNWFVRAKRIVT